MRHRAGQLQPGARARRSLMRGPRESGNLSRPGQSRTSTPSTSGALRNQAPHPMRFVRTTIDLPAAAVRRITRCARTISPPVNRRKPRSPQAGANRDDRQWRAICSPGRQRGNAPGKRCDESGAGRALRKPRFRDRQQPVHANRITRKTSPAFLYWRPSATRCCAWRSRSRLFQIPQARAAATTTPAP